MGLLYKQPASRIWWVKYYVHGRRSARVPARQTRMRPRGYFV
jgi:hypothetical protein